ncbi:MAG: 16S rRNA (guanine(966)-N(2))-methyltransferase RsmD [Candidatus Nanopelagicales bacterium]
MTRIISGTARGRTLKVPAKGTRPTSDRVRESLFSALQSRLIADGLGWEDICVLDLYSGSGALGLEALSRGARDVWLVEANRVAAGVITANIETLGIEGSHLLCADAAIVAKSRPSAATPAHVVLADPPYEVSVDVLRTMVNDLVSAGWLTVDAHVVIERPANDYESPFPAGWESQSRRMGDTVLWYGQAVDEDDSASDHSAEGS